MMTLLENVMYSLCLFSLDHKAKTRRAKEGRNKIAMDGDGDGGMFRLSLDRQIPRLLAVVKQRRRAQLEL